MTKVPKRQPQDTDKRGDPAIKYHNTPNETVKEQKDWVDFNEK